MHFNLLQEMCHRNSVKAGWWEADCPEDYFVATKYGLIHSEVSESFEAFRRDLMDDHLTSEPGAAVELADAVIRILDLAAHLGYDLEGIILRKLNYNRSRLDHKPEARAAKGGKKF